MIKYCDFLESGLPSPLQNDPPLDSHFQNDPPLQNDSHFQILLGLTEVWFEPTEVRKAQRILEVPRDLWSSLTFMSPNLKELESITQESPPSIMDQDLKFAAASREGEGTPTEFHPIVSRCFAQFGGLRLILLTRGKLGFTVNSISF